MTRRTRTFYGALLLAAMPLLAYCGDPAEPANRFDFTVNNQSTNSYEIYVNSTSGFTLLGTLGPAASVTYRNLVIGTTYTFRASAPGSGGPTTFVHEQTVSSTGPDQTWNITS